MHCGSTAPGIAVWERLWSVWDAVTLEMIPPGGHHDRPLELRHPFIFYLGHLPAFTDARIARVLSQNLTQPAEFSTIFARGIDPDMEDPSKCHSHSPTPAQWPPLEDILQYRDRVRHRITQLYTSRNSIGSSSSSSNSSTRGSSSPGDTSHLSQVPRPSAQSATPAAAAAQQSSNTRGHTCQPEADPAQQPRPTAAAAASAATSAAAAAGEGGHCDGDAAAVAGLSAELQHVLWMAYEHEAMHLETLLYMLVQYNAVLPPPAAVMSPNPPAAAAWHSAMQHDRQLMHLKNEQDAIAAGAESRICECAEGAAAGDGTAAAPQTAGISARNGSSSSSSGSCADGRLHQHGFSTCGHVPNLLLPLPPPAVLVPVPRGMVTVGFDPEFCWSTTNTAASSSSIGNAVDSGSSSSSSGSVNITSTSNSSRMPLRFGWDNESPARAIPVSSCLLQHRPVTVVEYLWFLANVIHQHSIEILHAVHGSREDAHLSKPAPTFVTEASGTGGTKKKGHMLLQQELPSILWSTSKEIISSSNNSSSSSSSSSLTLEAALKAAGSSPGASTQPCQECRSLLSDLMQPGSPAVSLIPLSLTVVQPATAATAADISRLSRAAESAAMPVGPDCTATAKQSCCPSSSPRSSSSGSGSSSSDTAYNNNLPGTAFTSSSSSRSSCYCPLGLCKLQQMGWPQDVEASSTPDPAANISHGSSSSSSNGACCSACNPSRPSHVQAATVHAPQSSCQPVFVATSTIESLRPGLGLQTVFAALQQLLCVKTVFGPVPVSISGYWPVYCSALQAESYASWWGGGKARLPTEPELLLAQQYNAQLQGNAQQQQGKAQQQHHNTQQQQYNAQQQPDQYHDVHQVSTSQGPTECRTAAVNVVSATQQSPVELHCAPHPNAACCKAEAVHADTKAQAIDFAVWHPICAPLQPISAFTPPLVLAAAAAAAPAAAAASGSKPLAASSSQSSSGGQCKQTCSEYSDSSSASSTDSRGGSRPACSSQTVGGVTECYFVSQLCDNGWEWTSTSFSSHEGFKADPLYPEYSQDFFEGKHAILLGGSWATHASIASRRTLRNWYQRGQQHVFAKFRLCQQSQQTT